MSVRALAISYNQVAVFLSTLKEPFNNWTDLHVKQGFAWRPGSVSFATLEEVGLVNVEVVRQPVDTQSSDAERIIVVPFEVDDSGRVEIASIADSEPISLPHSSWRLIRHEVPFGGHVVKSKTMHL